MQEITVQGVKATYTAHHWESEDKNLENTLNHMLPEMVEIPELGDRQEAHYEQVAVRRAQDSLVGVIVQQKMPEPAAEQAPTEEQPTEQPTEQETS